MRLVGIDGCRAGWVLAVGDPSLTSLHFEITSAVGPVLRAAEDGETVIAVDIPIGLSEQGDRTCDRAARAYLGHPRSSSVFPAPCRRTLAAASYQEARELNFRSCGKRVSAQLYRILSKIGEVDLVMTPSLQRWVREAHPEVTFAALGGTGRGLLHSKKTSEGEQERLSLLRRFLPPFDPGDVRIRLGATSVSRDDIVDAAACLVTAYRISTGEVLVLPAGEAPCDARGLRMEIVA